MSRLGVVSLLLLALFVSPNAAETTISAAAAKEVETFEDATQSKYQERKEITSDDVNYSADCHKDKKRAPKADNYDFTCTSPTALKKELTNCCASTSSDATGCCDRNAMPGVGDPSKMKKIVGIMGGVTGALCIIVFCCTWCDKKTFPFLERVEDRFKEAYTSCEESCCCCKNQVEKRRALSELEAEGGVNYDTPSHVKERPREEYWGNQQF